MTDQPSISVVIPVYNTERFLGRAIESVLRQSEQVTEILVVDDGSTDNSRAIAQGYESVRYLYQANAGQAAARNRGVSETTGDMLAFLDADDLWTVNKVEKQLGILRENPDVGAVFGNARQFIDPTTDGSTIRTHPSEPRPAHLPAAMLVRREVFNRIGPYRTDLVAAEVVDWYARALDSGISMLTLPDVVLLRRIHDANLGRTTPNTRPAYLSAIRSAIQRRRSGAADDGSAENH